MRPTDADLFSKHTAEEGIYLEYDGAKKGIRVPTADQIGVHKLRGDGDFRSEECVRLLRQADIVVTNPPFSLFREYITQLVAMKKKFLVIANHNAITYKEIFALLKANKIWLGYTHPVAFIVPDHYEMREVRSWRDANGTNWRSLGNACWFTNLDIAKRHEDLILYKAYKRKDYPRYDNHDAIEVSRFADIPSDYDGVMGVPITFLENHNPDQFEIVGITKTWYGSATKTYPPQTQVSANGEKSTVTKLNGRRKISKILPDDILHPAPKSPAKQRTPRDLQDTSR